MKRPIRPLRTRWELFRGQSTPRRRTSVRHRPGLWVGVAVSALALTWLAGGSPAVRAQACAPGLTNSLIAWWPADGHAYDVINQKAALLQGGATYSTAGKVASAFSFNGTSAKVFVAESTKTDLSRIGTRWTIEGWVKPANFSNSAFPTIYTEGKRIASLGINKDTGLLESWINGANRYIGTVALTLNDWNHVALVKDGATRTLYVNGQPAGSTNNTPALTPDSNHAALGQTPQADPTTAFQGEIDELSLFSRALTAGEIKAIADAGSAGKCFQDTAEPRFVIVPEGQTNYLGGEVTFVALAMGSPRPTYQWEFKPTLPAGSGFVPLPDQTSYSLSLSNLTFAHDGTYKVTAASNSGSVSAEAGLTVKFCTDTPANLVAWWPGDGSGLDATGQHHGAVWGGVTWPAGVVENGPAFGFNGTDAYVAVPDAPELSPHVGPSGELTLEAWLYLDQLPGTDPINGSVYRGVVTKWESGAAEYGLWIKTDGTFGLWVYSADGTSRSATGGLVLTKTWNHLVGTLKKGEALRIFQNGAEIESARNTNADFISVDGRAPLYLGREGSGSFLPGRLDEAAVYSRALTADEIARLYDGGRYGKCWNGSTPKPSFAVQPSDQSGYYFLGASLSGLALGTPRPSYQWLSSNSTEWVAVPSATNATLLFTNLSPDQEGIFRLVASNSYGAVVSEAAKITPKCHDIVCSGANGEDFEKGWNGWTANNWIWQVGQGGAHRGVGLAATVLDGNYPDNASSWLVSPPFVLPPAGEAPRLRFWQYYTFSCEDGGQLFIRPTGGSWQLLAHYAGHSGGVWSRPTFDLSAYAGQAVELGFYFYSKNSGCNGNPVDVSDGWALDEVVVVTGPFEPWAPNVPESFEDGQTDWYVTSGTWEIGSGLGYAGPNGAGTVRAGNYFDDTSSWLIGPPLVVPAAGENPRLRFWQYYTFSCEDGGQLLIRANGGDWQLLAHYTGHSGGVWSRTAFDLSAYAGQTVELGFYFYSKNSGCNGNPIDVSDGWYVDEIVVVTGPFEPWTPNVPESFEDGQTDWYVTSGTWEIGSGLGYAGPNGAGTVRDGNYYDDTGSWLVGPPLVVPAAGENPRLRFWQYYSFSCEDYGQVSIRPKGGAWQPLATYSGHSGGVWSRTAFDLSAYAGQTVELGFYFYSKNSGCNGNPIDVSDGWYVDEIVVVTGPFEPWTPNVPESFEDGQTDWYVTSGTWEIGSGLGYAGPNGAGTVRDGNYYDDTGSWLVGPPLVVPAAGENPRLRFWQYYSFSCEDYGQVSIRPKGGAWQPLATYSGHSGGVWSRPAFDLSAYAGQTVELGFYFYSKNSGCNGNPIDVSDGWYVDDIVVLAGAPPTVNSPEAFEGGLGDWYATSGTWEVGRPLSGPGEAHSGTTVAATVLSGNYYDDTSSYLVSPSWLVPAAGENPQLVFWQWYNFNCDDYGEVKIWNGSQWDTLLRVSGNGAAWQEVQLPLSSYAGKTVQLGLYFYSRNSSCNGNPIDVAAGWYIDDVVIQRGALAIAAIPARSINEVNTLGQPSALRYQLQVVGAGPGACLSFSLPWAPPGAFIDPETGVVTWTPSECQGPGVYNIPVYVVDYCNNEANDLGVLKVTVNEVNETPWLLPSVEAVAPGQTLEFTPCTGDPDCPRNPLKYELYKLTEAIPAGATIDPNTGTFKWTPTVDQLRPTKPYVMGVRLCDNGSPNQCVTSTITVTVTDHAPFEVDIQSTGEGKLEFTIVGGRTDTSYVLERTSALYECPFSTPWEYVLKVTPTSAPFTFEYAPPDWNDQPVRFFRVKEAVP